MTDNKVKAKIIAYLILILFWVAMGIAAAFSTNSLVWQRIFAVYCVYKIITYGYYFAEETAPTTKGE